MADNFLAGTAYLTVNGQSRMLIGEFAYQVTQTKNETLIGMDTVHGVKKTPAAGMIKGKCRDSGSLSMSDVVNADDVTVVVELANGKTVTGRNMWRAGDPVEVEGDEASYSIQWEGADVRDN